MDRVSWDGFPLEEDPPRLPANLRETIFDYLPAPVPKTAVIEEMTQKYRSGEFTKTPQHYGAMQAACFIHPKSQDDHRQRRDKCRLRAAEAEADGFVVPDVFRELVETDAYVDRLHHYNTWLEMPEELWRFPRDRSRLVFLAFADGGHGGYNYHLLLGSDGSHCVICCEHPFGLPSIWPLAVPDYSQWEVARCADSIEEWLYHYFLESAEHDRGHIKRLRPYHPDGWNGY